MVEKRPAEGLWASYSSIGQHRSCPQKWYYQRILHIEPIEPEVAPARDFGSWWHALMAADSLERGRTAGSLKSFPEWITATEGSQFRGEDVLPHDVLAESVLYWEKLSEDVKAAWVQYLGEPLPDRLLGAYGRWSDRWEEDREYELPLAVELGWGRDLADTGARLVGYIDEVFLDSKRNVVVVRDHKSMKALGTQTTQDDLMDSQLHLYAWGAAPAIEEWGVGPVRATAYDRMRAVAATTPKLTNAGQLSKQVTQYDLQTYIDWVAEGQTYPGTKKDGSGAGVYELDQNVVDHLSSPAWKSNWHQRTLTPINVNVIRSHLRAAADAVIDMQRSKEIAEARHEAPRNPGPGCRWCDYAKLCQAQLIGGPDGEYDLAAMGLRVRQDEGGRK